MSKLDTGPSDWTLGQILQNLRPAQIWGIGAAVVTLVSGAIAISYGMGARSNTEYLTTLERRLLMQEPQLEFASRYLRYVVAERAMDMNLSNTDHTQLDQAEQMFFDLICGWWRNQNSEQFKLHLTPTTTIIRKGMDPADSYIQFGGVATWTIPPHIKQKVLNDERCRAS